jgi:hypothetical protein
VLPTSAAVQGFPPEVVRLVLASVSPVKPDGKMTLADPRDWVLTVLAEQGVGLPVPQSRTVTVNDLAALPGAEVGVTTAE